MKISSIVRALVEAMATPEMILAAVEAVESASTSDTSIEARRASERERTRRYRERGGGNISPGLRQAIMDRDGGICQECGSQDYPQIDHVHPVSLGGETSEENLQVLCRVCNARKKDRVRKSIPRNSAEVNGIPRNPRPPLSDKENPPAPPKEINSPPLPPAVMIGAVDFESKILEAAGEMIHPHGAIVVGPILSLITAGADLELDVLPAIRATVARMAHPARSWSYFVPAIQAAFDRRIAAGKWEPSTRAQPPPKLTPHQQRHKAAMNAFDRQLGIKPDDEPASNIIDLEGRDFRSL